MPRPSAATFKGLCQEGADGRWAERSDSKRCWGHFWQAGSTDNGGSPRYAALRVENPDWGPAQSAAAATATALEEQRRQARLAAAKMIRGFSMKVSDKTKFERDSVYGGVILIPQLARSAGWPKFLVKLVLRSYFFLVANCMVQGMLLCMIVKEEYIMDLFAGQMYLCDFGASTNSGSWGKGPLGTPVTPARLYSFNVWQTRVYVKEALKAIFPAHRGTIEEKVDPGEYGVQSYGCRWLCCFIFMLYLLDDLVECYDLAKLLWCVPSADEPWIEPREGDGKDAAGCEGEADEEHPELQGVRLKVAGMPRFWKAVNFVIVLLPKALIWKITSQAGIMFLMETSDIENLIVNCVALAFVLNIDELMCATLMSDYTHVLLERLEDMPLRTPVLGEQLTDEEVMRNHEREQRLCCWSCQDLCSLIPWRFVLVGVLTVGFVFNYYTSHCRRNPEDGRWISRDIFEPISADFTILNAFFPQLWAIDVGSEPLWQMPER